MADPLREALAALVEQWQRDPGVSFDAFVAVRDLLAAHPAPAEPPAPEGAVRVRIAVAVDAEGRVAARIAWADPAIAALHALRELGQGQPLRLSWVEAWVPRPEAEQVVEGRVEPEGE